ncbi:hypothetical protein GCM10010299_60000 [Streptomyces tanashiensis]|nr:hypothetical protein GCM10010299_60000 [Streptomyces tanashiensis]
MSLYVRCRIEGSAGGTSQARQSACIRLSRGALATTERGNVGNRRRPARITSPSLSNGVHSRQKTPKTSPWETLPRPEG